jgi:branched-chain amino acid transport system substrate-binding protein
MRQKVQGLLLMTLCFSLVTINANAREFLVGTDNPTSGKLAAVGQSFLRGNQTAVEVFNQRHPEHKIKLLDIDNESNPAKAVAAVEKLVSQGVLAFAGGFGSNIVSPASDAANKAGKVYMTTGAIAGAMSKRGQKGFFRVNNAKGYAKAVIGFLKSSGIKSVSLLHSTKEATEALSRGLKAGLTKQGIKVVAHPFDSSMTDFKPVINKVRLQDKSEAILMICYTDDYMNIIRAAKVIKPPTVKMMLGAWSLATVKNREKFPELMPNVLGTAMMSWPGKFTSPEAKVFAAAFEKLHGEKPDYQGQFGYVQSLIVFEAILRAYVKGTLDTPGALAEEVRATDKETLLGHVTFDEFGENPNFTMYMAQHKTDAIPVVWPAQYATDKVVFPGTPWN